MRSSPGWAELRLALAGTLLLAACEPEAGLQREQLAAFGTLVTVSYSGVEPGAARRATAALEAHYRQRERDWYPWADGELAAVNAALARSEPVAVSDDLRRLLERAVEIEKLSGGLYNPALGALTEAWGFHDMLRDDWRPPAASTIDALLAGRPAGSQLRWQGQWLHSSNPALVIDPGGIAKGALLESSRALLLAQGIDDAIVDLGGDLLVLGHVADRAARIGIRRPDGDGALAWIDAQSGEAVMTSGNYERYFEHDGKRYAHVLDPQTGRPAAETASVTVVHRDPLLADAAATALLVAGSEGFEQTCAALAIDLALLVSASGDLRLTEPMRSRVHWLTP